MIRKSIDKCVGSTPLLQLSKFDTDCRILCKLEFFNPCSSIKDRAGRSIVDEAEKQGVLKPGATIIEATSGNTGIALAMMAAARNYKLIIVMPESMSVERRRMLSYMGAELVLTPAAKGMSGAVEEAERIFKNTQNAFMARQFANRANSQAHYQSTGPEIWRDCEGNIDFFVAGVGTGGTLSGAGRFLKEKNPQIQIVAVEPDGSAVLSGEKAGPHQIQGIGAGFIPEILECKLIDRIMKISGSQAMDTARMLARREGILCGISSGAAVAAALELASAMRDKTIVTVLPDTAERYLSTTLFDS